MYLTAARVSQALAVEWRDVDFKARKIRIAATNKGDDDRFAHMPDALMVALANIPGDRKGRVFVFKSRGNIKTQWEGAIRRAGIKRLTTHSNRHGFATWLLDMGVSPVAVAGRGGWKSVRHVLRNLRPRCCAGRCDERADWHASDADREKNQCCQIDRSLSLGRGVPMRL
jgi:integrase